MRTWAVLAVLTTALLAGCASAPPSQTPVNDPAWAVRAIFGDVDPADTDHIIDHDHKDRGLHKDRSTPNFEVLGWNPLVSDHLGTPGGTYYCGDGPADVDGRRYVVVHSLRSDVAMMVIDVTDADPVLVGELVMPQAFVYDVATFADGRYAALVTNPDTRLLPDLSADARGARTTETSAAPYWRTPCGEVRAVESQVDDRPFRYSTVLVDLEDPTRPVVADWVPHAARNMHSVSTYTDGDTRFILSAGLQDSCARDLPRDVRDAPCATVPSFGNLLSYFQFYTVEETPAGARLAPYAFYSGGDFGAFDPELVQLSNGHVDGTVERHPETGELVAYLANWDGGFIIVRLDGPGQVTHLATWGAASDDVTGTDMFGNAHSVVPVGMRDGRHITMFGQEVTQNLPGRPTGQVVLMDTTDPAAPDPVARWTLPVEVVWTSCCPFSTHYPTLVGDTLFTPVYHGGLWAADASPEHWPELPSIGVFLPDNDPPTEPVARSDAPEVLEQLRLDDDRLIVLDGDSGAYTVRFTGYHPDVRPAAPWTADAWIGTG